MQGGGLEDLERLLADDVTFWGDGGGKAPAIARPLHGTLPVARFIKGLVRRGGPLRIRLEPTQVNGGPGLLTLGPAGELLGVLTIEFDADGRVSRLRNQINPDKLQHLGAVGNLSEMMRGE